MYYTYFKFRIMPVKPCKLGLLCLNKFHSRKGLHSKLQIRAKNACIYTSLCKDCLFLCQNKFIIMNFVRKDISKLKMEEKITVLYKANMFLTIIIYLLD